MIDYYIEYVEGRAKIKEQEDKKKLALFPELVEALIDAKYAINSTSLPYISEKIERTLIKAKALQEKEI